MHLRVFTILAVVQVVFSQGISFQDGRLGVNFGGYNAGVGFGPGGLSASAGTPNGQRAEAGLGGTVNGNTAGGLYAGATAGQGIDASASLNGDVNNGFGSGQAQASAGGVSNSVVKTVGPVKYLPPNTAVIAPVPSKYLPSKPVGVAPSQTGHGIGSSSTFDADDNDLTHNTVPQTTNVLVQQPKPVDQRIVIQQTVPKVVHVQKIKVRRPPPSAYTVYQKQFRIPTYVTKTSQYPAPVYQQLAVPVKIKQIPIPVYQPVVYQKRILINKVPQVAVGQRFLEEIEPTEGPTTTTTSTTPRPIYQYTYDKTKVINEIFSIPYHILNSVNNLINAKLAGGYQVQKTITYK